MCISSLAHAILGGAGTQGWQRLGRSAAIRWPRVPAVAGPRPQGWPGLETAWGEASGAAPTWGLTLQCPGAQASLLTRRAFCSVTASGPDPAETYSRASPAVPPAPQPPQDPAPHLRAAGGCPSRHGPPPASLSGAGVAGAAGLTPTALPESWAPGAKGEPDPQRLQRQQQSITAFNGFAASPNSLQTSHTQLKVGTSSSQDARRPRHMSGLDSF